MGGLPWQVLYRAQAVVIVMVMVIVVVAGQPARGLVGGLWACKAVS